MKKKIANFVIDVSLLMIIFTLTDWVMLHVLHSEKILPEIFVYIVFYGTVFGLKKLICSVWRKRKRNSEK